MKKLFRLLITSLLVFTILFTFMGIDCTLVDDPIDNVKTEWDGQFLYYYIEGKDRYAIVGMDEDLNRGSREPIDELYIPTHYKGKEVRYSTYYFLTRSVMSTQEVLVGIDLSYVNKVYFSYLTKPTGIYDGWGEREKNYVYWNFSSAANETYIVNNSYMCYLFTEFKLEKKDQSFYYTKLLYDKILQNLKDTCPKGEEINTYSFCCTPNLEFKRNIVAANTAYMFNYEDSPNEDYFFINNFERGEKIENTPYEPIRDGYTFTGWYKDEDCTEKWNFETDTLPKWEYDEDGNEIFVETKLYAGWSKNN